MKQINDTQGHDAGDTLLKIFSESLTSCSRPEDKLYRLGGDEFAMILNGAGHCHIDSIIHRVKSAVKKTQQADYPNIDASIGFASLSEINDDANAWFQLADERMYKHKKSKITNSLYSLQV
jgi:diguanylate cyclase (GGDEF)-like protein